MSNKIDELNKLISELPKEKSGEIAHFIESKLELLKICYEKSGEKHYQNLLKSKIKYPPLKSYITGEAYRGKSIKVESIAYDEKSIRGHIEKGLPQTNNRRGIEIYNFYFGGYKNLFLCFNKKFLVKTIQLDTTFLENIFSKEDGSIEVSDKNIDKGLHKELNSVPVLEIENYITRIPILEEISNLYEQKNKKINIIGISGIGKTFLAKHFIQHYSEKFTHIVWLNCSNGFVKAFSQEKGVDLLYSIGLISEYQSYTEEKISEQVLMRMALGYLKNIKGNNILILDNVDDEILFYEDEINLFSDWNILTTSHEALDGFYNYSIPYFNEESINLFYKYYTLEIDDDNLIRLLSTFEYHTLTIELLAKTADQMQISIMGLVNRFTAKGVNVVERAKVNTPHNLERKLIVENIEIYLNIIFDTSALEPEECKILFNIALLQDDSIDYNIFKEIYLSDDTDQRVNDNFIENINRLQKKGWVSKENDSIRLHSLTKNIVLKRFSLNEDFYNLKYLSDIISFGMSENYIEKLKYLTICENVLINNRGGSSIIIEEIMKGISHLYQRLGLHHKSHDLLLTLISTDQSTDADKKNFMYQELARSLYYLKNFDEALRYYQKVTDYYDGNRTEGNIDQITKFYIYICESDYAVSILSDSQFLNNASLWMQALVLYSHALNDIGSILDDKGQVKESIEILEKALHYRSLLVNGLNKFLLKNGEIHGFSQSSYKTLLFNYSVTCNSLATSYQCNKQYDKARNHFETAIKIREQILDDDNPNLFNVYNSISKFYIEIGDFENALKYAEKNLLLCDNLPSNDSKRESAISNYFAVYNLGCDKKAPIIMEAIQKEEEVVKKEIEKRFEKLNLKNQNNNQNYTDLIKYFEVIAGSYSDLMFYEKAISYFKKKLFMEKHFVGKNSLGFGATNYNIASCYEKMNKPTQGIQFLNTAIEIYYEILEENHPYLKDLYDLRKRIIKKCYLLGDEELIKNEFLSRSFSKENTIEQFISTTKELYREVGGNENEVDEIFSKINFDEYYNSYIEQIGLFFLNDDKEIINEELVKHFALNKEKKPDYVKLIIYYDSIMKIFLEYELMDRAIFYCFKILTIQEKYITDVHPLGLGRTYFNLGGLHLTDKKYELAEKYNNKAIQIFSHYCEGQWDEKDLNYAKQNLKRAISNNETIFFELSKHKHT